MRTFVFRSNTNPEIMAHTFDARGATLPEQYGPWTLAVELDHLTDNLEIVMPLHTPLGRGLRTDGLFLTTNSGEPLENALSSLLARRQA